MVDARPPDESLAWKVLLGSSVVATLATIAVFLRFIARRISAAGFWWDDWTILAALFVQWGMGISRWIPISQFYYGHHTIYVGRERLIKFQKTFVGIQTLYFLNAVLTKVSLLLLYYRIFGVVKKFRIAIYVSLFIVVAYWIPCTIIAFLGCTPFERNWNKTIPGSCVDLVTFFRWNGICNLLIDFLILLLPLPMVWTLNIPVRQRLELTGIFALGLFVCVTSIMRVLAYKPTQLHDATYSGVDSMTWSIVEQGIGVVCACLPTFRPLMICCGGNRTRNRTKESGSSGIGMDSYKGSAIDDMSKAWKSTLDSESTVGFARLDDEDRVMTPADVQKSVYAPIGAAITTGAGRTGANDVVVVPSAIVKETQIDCTSEPR